MKFIGRRRDVMAILGMAIMLFSLVIPGFLSVKETRISAALPVSLASFSVIGLVVLLAVSGVTILLSFGGYYFLMGLAGGLAPVYGFFLAGSSAVQIASETGPFARASPSIGLWILLLAGYVVVFAARRKLKDKRILSSLLVLIPIASFAVLLGSGTLRELAIMKEYANRSDRFLEEMARHLLIAGGAVVAGVIIGVPLGVAANRSPKVEKPVFGVVNFIQTIPSIALFGLLIAPLSYLSRSLPFLRELGITGVGWAPAMIALVLYSLLPIVRNTYSSLKVIPADTVEAARAMGMSRLQVLGKVEIPISLPVVLAGVRTAAVQAVGNTTMAALIGAGGLGVFVFQGLGQAAMDLVLLGALPIVALALIVDSLMQLLIAILTPRGLVSEVADD
ncbi:Binding-protein-dependent transport systems inner membrane component [Mesotoga infera]|nr:Binding-protein-dependent transport systems inner membrane component [Mesotoga infera]